MKIYEVNGRRPVIGKDTWIAPTAQIIGDVRIGDNCYVGYADYSDEIVEIGGEDTIAVITRTWSLGDDCGNQAEDQACCWLE